MISAKLQYRGFSELVARQRHEPHWYDYQRKTTERKWYPMSGLFTRYGDCTQLITSDDDRMVVMGSGDEMIIRFSANLPSLQPGFTRSFILHSVGWDKDADLNTLTGQTSLPLPFKNMHSYPAPIDQFDEQSRVDALNADTLTRNNLIVSFGPTCLSSK